MGTTGCRMSMPSKHPVEATTIQQLQMNPHPLPPAPPSGVDDVPPPAPPPAPPPPQKPAWIMCDCATSASWAYGMPELKPEPVPEDHSQRRDRDRMERPVPAHDARCLVMELKRPSAEYSFSEAQRAAIPTGPPTLTLEFVQSLDDDAVQAVFSALVSDLGVQRLLLATQPLALRVRIMEVQGDPEKVDVLRSALEHIASEFKCRNGRLVQFNPALTSCTKSNTAPYFLGTAEQARAAVFYVIKYVTKDKVNLTGSMSVLLDARKHIEKYPSVAANTGTTTRTGQHFLQRTLNTLAGSAEYGGPQGASITLGYPGSYISHEFEYLFTWDVVSWVKEFQKGTLLGRGCTAVVREGLPVIAAEEELLYDFECDELEYRDEEQDTHLSHGVFATLSAVVPVSRTVSSARTCIASH